MGLLAQLLGTVSRVHISLVTVSLLSVLAAILYTACLAVYRIWFSPLRNIPGSRLTIATGWYETYCEIVKNGGGQFSMQIPEWHRRYGPIIRINPHEIHINDPQFYDTIYPVNMAQDKMKSFERRFNTPLATFSTTEHDLHRIRRTALNPYFSRGRILEFVPRLHEHTLRLCDRLNRDFRGTGKVIVLNDVLVCVLADAMLDFAFNMPSHLVEEPNFDDQFTTTVRDLQRGIHYLTAFPWIASVCNCIPETWIEQMFPATRSVLQFRRKLSKTIKESKERLASPLQKAGVEARSQPVVFDELLQSSLPASEVSHPRLLDEAFGIVGAGTETTRFAATVAFFHILDQPPIYKRLKEELAIVVPGDGPLPPLTTLEALPWLSACIEEGIRLSYGGASRSPRVFSMPLSYSSYTIPAGTPISSETYSIHHNEHIYPDSWSYRPERWLNDPKVVLAPGSPPTKLSRYMTAFGRGSRICVGMPLAYAELYIILATLIRRYDFELFETDRSAVDCVRMALGPLPRDDTKGVRVIIS